MPEDAGIEPRNVATLASAVRLSKHSARSHPVLNSYLINFFITMFRMWIHINPILTMALLDPNSGSSKAKEPRARIFILLRSPGIDSKESIPPAYVAWRAGTTTIFLLGS